MAIDGFTVPTGGTATETVTYLYHDHLGSVEVTSDPNGQNVQRYSYDTWGKARATGGATAYQPIPWGSCLSPTPAGQQTGYTGHENLDDECLVHMEGRVYIPDLGKFLSADPNVQNPMSTQGYNRYAYVGNNPV
ncbi:MAG TPA: RHS repeat-associated core domain-containing protein [Gammaproteobacteria bacterium]|nr:RHS repeat-associated core domain-containing protein [Gammaproteobacteria bacterium]